MAPDSVVERKAASVRSYLKSLDELRGRNRSEIEADPNLRAALERFVYLAIQASIDLAGIVIATKNLRKPATRRDGFRILFDVGVITEDALQDLTELVEFRNELAYEYDTLTYESLERVLKDRTGCVARFVDAVEAAA